MKSKILFGKCKSKLNIFYIRDITRQAWYITFSILQGTYLLIYFSYMKLQMSYNNHSDSKYLTVLFRNKKKIKKKYVDFAASISPPTPLDKKIHISVGR